jgi:hypothetical protein
MQGGMCFSIVGVNSGVVSVRMWWLTIGDDDSREAPPAKADADSFGSAEARLRFGIFGILECVSARPFTLFLTVTQQHAIEISIQKASPKFQSSVKPEHSQSQELR